MSGTDPWRDAPTSELQDQILPRWFVLLGAAMVAFAVAAAVGAFVIFGPQEVPVADRRPPPADGYTTAVGQLQVGSSVPVALTPAPCRQVAGVRVAGTEADRLVLGQGLAALCAAVPEGGAGEQLGAFASAGGVVRFATFRDTGVDSTARADPPLILLNARFAVTEPAWIAPLVVHDTVTLAGAPGTVTTALDARRAESAACDGLAAGLRRSRACADAAALLALDDAAAALRAAGYR